MVLLLLPFNFLISRGMISWDFSEVCYPACHFSCVCVILAAEIPCYPFYFWTSLCVSFWWKWPAIVLIPGKSPVYLWLRFMGILYPLSVPSLFFHLMLFHLHVRSSLHSSSPYDASHFSISLSSVSLNSAWCSCSTIFWWTFCNCCQNPWKLHCSLDRFHARRDSLWWFPLPTVPLPNCH